MRRILLSLGLILGLLASAAAQVNVVPQVGVTSAYVKQKTYSAASVGLVPASSATDIFCISGSSSAAISVKQISISGTAGTLVTAPFTLLRRTTLDTGGTATTTALPVAAPNMSSDPAATATLTAYTANPTINDASPTYFRSSTLTLNTTGTTVQASPLVWSFGERIGDFAKALDIPKASTAQQYCINLNAVSVSSGVLNIDITWVEN